MPKVYTKVARKDYPEIGVSKGQTYYIWKNRVGLSSLTRKSATYPTRSQLTTSSFLSTVYDIFDRDIAKATCLDDLQSAADALRDAGSEAEDSLSNMPDSLQSGPTGEMLQTCVDSCEEAASAIEELISELEDEVKKIEAWDEWLAARPDGQERCEDTQEQPETVSDEDWREWVEARPEEPDHETEEDAVQAVVGDIEEPDWG